MYNTRHSIEEKLKISFAHFQQCSSVALNGSKPFDLIYTTAAVCLTNKYSENHIFVCVVREQKGQVLAKKPLHMEIHLLSMLRGNFL